MKGQEMVPFHRVAVWIEPDAPISVVPGTAKMRQSGRWFDPDFVVVPVWIQRRFSEPRANFSQHLFVISIGDV